MKGLFQRVMRVKRAVIFRKDSGGKKGYYGHVYTHSRRPILINLGLHERRLPSRTLLHETLHILYPDMSERQIRALEEALWNTLTAKQRFLLSKKLFNRTWRTK